MDHLEGQLICFAYEHRYRLVLVDRVWHSAQGNELITGLDEDRNEIRSFRTDRILRGRVRLVGQQKDPRIAAKAAYRREKLRFSEDVPRGAEPAQ